MDGGTIWVWWVSGQVLVGIGLAVAFLGVMGDRLRGGQLRRRCPGCGYDMVTIRGLVCPECGKRAKNEKRLFRSRRSRVGLATGACVVMAGLATIGLPMARTGIGFRFLPRIVQCVLWPLCEDDGAVSIFCAEFEGEADEPEKSPSWLERKILRSTAEFACERFDAREDYCSSRVFRVVINHEPDPLAAIREVLRRGSDKLAVAAANAVEGGVAVSHPTMVALRERISTTTDAGVRANLVRAYVYEIAESDERLSAAIELFHDPADEVAEVCSPALGEGPAAARVLVQLLDDADSQVRARALLRLCNRAGMAGQIPWATLLRLTADDHQQVAAVARAVLMIIAESNPEILGMALSSHHAATRLVAVEALQAMDPPPAGTALVLAAKAADLDEDPLVREAAGGGARGLGARRARGAVMVPAGQ